MSNGYYHSVWGCFSDMSQCCDTYWFPCCQMGRQCAAVEGQPHSCGCGMCLVGFCFPEFMPMCIRCKVSDKFQLGENCCTSMICGLCCYQCSLCQTGRELNYRGVNPGGCCCLAADYVNPDAAKQQPGSQQGYPQQQVSSGAPNQPPQGPAAPQYYQAQSNIPPSNPSYGNNNAYGGAAQPAPYSNNMA